ncbi:tyrosine-protein phosphatase [Candidatus Laterigemmans baculatus]|uniref:tyrosine-protein phosphatase n=1 Tax=Candidatus Laterigemmans baculatus TaxID=2770505 RepID=UPI0013DC4FDA|nr:CpsB/CapC family capsule biosynthesis tyrosine phosphatase [Candidatus Laterigemmans baculatus]
MGAATDIHCHLLPGIDDGAKSWEESLHMAQQAVAEGIVTAIVTPHQLGANTHNRGATIRQLTHEFQLRLNQANIPLRVLPGADVRIDSDMIDRLRSGDCLSLGDHRRHVLLELPHELYFPLEPVLGQLSQLGMVGILSHPERNQGILRRPDLIPSLVAGGCLMQITADSLIGTFGAAPQRFSEMMVQNGWVHFLATDAHSPRSRRPRIVDAKRRVVELAGVAYAEAVCVENPAAIAAGRSCPELPMVRRGGFWSRWFGKRAA